MLHRLSLLLLLLCSAIVAPATLRIHGMKARGICRDLVDNGNGFVKVYYNNNDLIGTTQVKNGTANPVWRERFLYRSAYTGNRLKLRVYDKKVDHDHMLGVCTTKIFFGYHELICSLITGGKLEYRYSMR